MRSFLTPLEVEAAVKVVAGVVQLFTWATSKNSGNLTLNKLDKSLYLVLVGVLKKSEN